MTNTPRTMWPLSIIVAVDEAGGFGKDGKIPWHFSADLKHFKETTMGGVCIMGRRTYKDLLEMQQKAHKKKASKKTDLVLSEILPGRETFVVSTELTEANGAKVVKSIREAVETIDANDRREIFILGGFRMYVEALTWVDRIYMTVVPGRFDCDVSFPIKVLKQFTIKSGKKVEGLRFVTYVRNRK